MVTGSDPVTVSIPHEITTAALSYDPSNFNKKRLRFGQRSVRFEPCSASELTQFNGSFLVTAPICLPLDVTDAGADDVRTMLPLGAPCDNL